MSALTVIILGEVGWGAEGCDGLSERHLEEEADDGAADGAATTIDPVGIGVGTVVVKRKEDKRRSDQDIEEIAQNAAYNDDWIHRISIIYCDV